jgi:hypothetical protein
MAHKRKRPETSLARRILYWTSHVFCAFLVVIVFLTLVQCTIKKPEAPSWQTNLVVPLANKTWNMAELIEKLDQENLEVDSLGNPIFYFENVLDTVSLNGSFAIGNVSQTVAESLGIISLDPFSGANVNINLGDYLVLVLGDIPPVSFDISEQLPAMTEFSSATIANGNAVVTIVNNFGLDLDTVIVTINDDVLASQVTTYSIPGGIPAGQTAVDTIDLSGSTISNQLSALIHCHTPGATSFSLSGKTMDATFDIPAGLSVSSATAEIPQISKSFSQNIDITGDHQLEVAVLDNGQLTLDIQNNTNLSATLTVTLSDIKNNGSSLVINQPVNPAQSQQITYNLTGYTLEPTDQVMPQSIAFDVDAVIDSSGSQMVTISEGDDITVITSVENLSFGSVQGIIGATSADFDSIQQDINPPKGFDNIQLPSAVLTLAIENAVNIPGSFTINVNGDQGQQKVINGSIAPGTTQSPVTTVIIDSSISTLMNPLPSLITVDGSATFGDGLTSGSITPNDYVVASITLSSPLEMIIDSTTFDGGVESSKIDQSDITKITDNFKLAQIYTTVVNHLPLGASAEILMGGDSATLYSNPEVRLGPIVIDAGAVGPDGTVDSAIISQNVLTFDSVQVRVLENDILWIGELVTLHSTNSSSVRVTGWLYRG